jgi:transcriptional regulator GlxA family with amidase domain
MRLHPLAVSCLASFALAACQAAQADPPGAGAVHAVPAAHPAGPLRPPLVGAIRVAFAISENTNVIDMSGPWEVFQDAPGSFDLFTVSRSREPLRLTAGLQVIPDHTFAEAPQPQVVVVPAGRGGAELHAWLRQVAPRADVVMSVCTGAFQLAAAGLLDGRPATTHHEFWDHFAARFPAVLLRRGPRFVEADDRIATAGGLTSGIDLALRVVERYYGPAAAERTAAYMEYRRVQPR